MRITIGTRPDHGFDEPLGLLSDCHRRIEHFLQILTTIVDRDAAGGSLDAAHRMQLEAALRYFATAAPKHTADEEQSLFPRLRASDDPAAAQALATVARLERDHGEADAHHRAVDALVRQWLERGVLDLDAASDLRARLSALNAIYREHIGVEDRELFPTAARVLSAEQVREIGSEMAARRR
jgi:hemerythrin-like domain-containing protein